MASGLNISSETSLFRCGESPRWHPALPPGSCNRSRTELFRRRVLVLFFFKQKTAYDIGLGIPAEPLSDLVDGMNIISNDGSNKLNRSRKARVSYKVQRTINASLNAATSTRAVSSNPNFVTRQKIEII